jgi:nucleoid-associated protein YgaU
LVEPPSAPASPAPTEPVAPEPVKNPPPAAGSDGYVELPSVGKGRSLEDDPFAVEPPSPASPSERVQAETFPTPSSTTASAGKPGRVGAGKDRDSDPNAPVLHVVQRGENFWTISQLYYNSGRFYKALWWANRREVPQIDKLYVDQTIRIPPPEDLDRSRIEPVKTSTASTTQVRKAARPAPKTNSLNVDLPASDPFEKRKAAGAVSDALDSASSTDANQRYRPRGPLYKVRANETLRSIARDTLGTSRRADEILEKNADVIDDPTNLIVGQVLELPEDAKVGRRRR